MTPFVLDTYDLLATLRGPDLARVESRGLIKKDDVDPTKFLLERRLRIVHPTDTGAPNKVGGTGRLPIAVLVHGNHQAIRPIGVTPNLNGYGELQKELAEKGIISVSVDENVAILFGSLIEMRAQMVLGALDTMRTLDADPTSRFHGRIDFDRVALMGHSRGGDAVVRAAQINRGRTAPTKYGVKAVCSLSPTDFSAILPPGPTPLTPSDTPFYAVVYGALDGDVAGWEGAESFGGTGFRHYDRATCDKAMVFLDHCNHNRFNSVWAADGDDAGMHPTDVAPGGRLLSEAEHHQLSKEYIGGLFRWKLLGDTTPQGLFDGTATNTLGAGVSLQWTFGSQIVSIDDMENPVKPRIITGAFVDPFADIVIGTRDLGTETNHATAVLGVEPPLVSGEAYTVSLLAGQTDWSGFDALTFRVAADYDLTSAATIAAGQLPEFSVVVTDTTGATALIDSATLAGPFVPRRPVFHQAVNNVGTTENCTALRLETMRLPVTAVTGIDLTRVGTVGLMAAPGMLRHLFFDSLQLVKS
jgi:hypothetical protein